MSSNGFSKNRLLRKIEEAKRKRRKLFAAFLTLGYPDLKSTAKLIEGLSQKGVDIIELGFPFSDPLADGPTIQFSSESALKRGVTLNGAFQMVRHLRRQGVETPLIFFSYLNPIFHSGAAQFPGRLKEAGFDGLIVPDCPPEEDPSLWEACEKSGVAPVFLVTPTTTMERARKIFARSKGFIYYVSVRGVTGARGNVPVDLGSNLRKLKRLTRRPILVGFGVSSPLQVKAISRLSDGVIVGSGIIDRIRKSKGRLHPVFSYVGSLLRSLRN